MKRFASKLLASVVLTLAAVTSSQAGVIFAGSWSVPGTAENPAPDWYIPGSDNGPLAYTAQEAAALLFGGVATDYYISTAGDQVANINHLAWYDVKGWGANVFAEDYNKKYLGLYYGPTIPDGSAFGELSASAFVSENFWEFDETMLNYAFRITPDAVPDTGATAAFLALGLAGFVAARRKVAAQSGSFPLVS